jgi:hypothetical protein
VPKIGINSALTHISGTMDRWVYKNYKDKRGPVLSRRPNMSKVKPSAAQLAQRKRMRDAADFHRKVLADPELLTKFRQLAAEMGSRSPRQPWVNR